MARLPSHARGWVVGWARLQWLLVPLAVLGLAEGYVRHTVDRLPTWYGAAERLVASERVDVIFMGSSRTQMAIVTRAFEHEALRRGAGPLRVLNLGRGYSTDAQHFLGLRRLLAVAGERLRGLTVVYEAPGGLPFPTRFRTSAWAHADQPWMIVDLLRPAELPPFWRAPGLDLETRLHISLRVLLRPLAMFNRRERLRQQWFEEALPALAEGRIPDLTPNEPLGYDLRGPFDASIRTDSAAVATARASAERIAEQMLRQQAAQRNWDGTIVDRLRALLEPARGRLCFYVPPQGEVFLRAYRTPLRLEDARLFAERARSQGGCVIQPEFAYDDSDMPDLWHLERGRADEFTRAVATAYFEGCPSPAR